MGNKKLFTSVIQMVRKLLCSTVVYHTVSGVSFLSCFTAALFYASLRESKPSGHLTLGLFITHQRQPGFASVSLHFQGSGEEHVTVLFEAAAQLSVLPCVNI